jgi:hypothetical protein
VSPFCQVRPLHYYYIGKLTLFLYDSLLLDSTTRLFLMTSRGITLTVGRLYYRGHFKILPSELSWLGATSEYVYLSAKYNDHLAVIFDDAIDTFRSF